MTGARTAVSGSDPPGTPAGSGPEAPADGPGGKRRRILFRIGTLVAALLLATAAAELLLRAFPVTLLGEDRAAALFDRYNTRPGGMYFFDGEAGINVMWPSAEMTAYSHGYFWDHLTDARGFRNPPDRSETGLLLLGDSMIYGHGVEDRETVAGVLHRDFGLPAYNMARQGDCLYQHYVLLRLFLEELAPRTVLLFVYTNDFSDLLKTRGWDRIDGSPEIDFDDYREIRGDIARRGAQRPRVPFRERLLLSRLLAGMAGPERKKPPKIPAAGKKEELLALEELGALPKRGEKLDLEQARRGMPIFLERGRLPAVWPTLEPAEVPRIEGYYRRILLDLKRRCDEADARLVLVNLAIVQEGLWRVEFDGTVANMLRFAGREATPEARSYAADFLLDLRIGAVDQVAEVTNQAAREAGVEYLDLSRDFLSADNYLPGDGHLSAEGHRRLADRLRGFLAATECAD